VNSPDEEIAALSTPGFDPKTTAFVDASKFTIKGNAFSTEGATAKVKTWKANEIVYDASTPGPGLLVMSENYYPKGWSATVDGQPAELVRVDYTLRALELAPGKHEVKVSFAPASFATGNLVSLISSLLIYALLGYALFLAYKESKKADEALKVVS
jgi:uncharacterized membrane protein YfhO